MDIIFSTTTQLAAAIQSGQLSASEAVEAHLAHIDQHNPALNAVVTLNAEPARARARAADEAQAVAEVSGPFRRPPGY